MGEGSVEGDFSTNQHCRAKNDSDLARPWDRAHLEVVGDDGPVVAGGALGVVGGGAGADGHNPVCADRW